MLSCNVGNAQIKLLSNGRIGIGTVTPSTNVEVYAPNVLFKSSTSTNNIRIQYLYGSSGIIEPTVNNTGYLGYNTAWYDVKSYNVHCFDLVESSDERIKKNVRDLDKSLDKVLKMRGVMYDISEDYLNNPDDPEGSAELIEEGKDEIGLLAQELIEIVPEAVVYDSLKDEYGIRYTRLIPILIEAMKEHDKKIKELDKKIKNNSSGLKDTESAEIITANTSALGKNHPNPFTENTSIEYYLSTGVKSATLYIYDLQGKQLNSIPITGRENGQVTIHGSELQPGMYYYSLIADG